MTVLEYFADIARAVAPPLIRAATCALAHARITQPEDNDTVTIGKVSVSGTYRCECGLSFVLLHHHDNNYWPQGSPVLDRTRHRWHKDIYINPPIGEKHYISIATITSDVRLLFNYYYHVGQSTKQWTPIVLYQHQFPNGLTILHTIRVQPQAA
jgi:hypothetical protein